MSVLFMLTAVISSDIYADETVKENPTAEDVVYLKNYLLNNSEYDKSYDYNNDGVVNYTDLITLKKSVLDSDFRYTRNNFISYYSIDDISEVITTYDELIALEESMSSEGRLSETYNQEYFNDNVSCVANIPLMNYNMITVFKGVTNADGVITLNYDIFDQSVQEPMYSAKGTVLEIPKSCYHGEKFEVKTEYYYPSYDFNIFNNIETDCNEDTDSVYRITSYDELVKFEDTIKDNSLLECYNEDYFKYSSLYVYYLTDNDNANYNAYMEFFGNINVTVNKYQNNNDIDSADYKATIITMELPKAFDVFEYGIYSENFTVYDTDVNRSQLECNVEHLQISENIPNALLRYNEVKTSKELVKFINSNYKYNLSDYIDRNKYNDEFFDKYFLTLYRLPNAYYNQYSYKVNKYEYYEEYLGSSKFNRVQLWGDKIQNPDFIQNEDDKTFCNILLIALPKDYSDCIVACNFN